MPKKKVKKTVTKSGGKNRDQYTMVLEDLRDQFGVFDEGLSLVSDKLDEHTKILDEHTKILGEHTKILDRLDARVFKLETDMAFVKEELAMIRHNMVTREELRLLEARVTRLERQSR